LWEPPPTLAQVGDVERLMQAAYVSGYYVWRPWLPAGLAPVYTTLVEFNPRDWLFVASLLGVSATTIVLHWQRRRWSGLWALWLVHLIVLVPMLGLTEHPHYASDRYSYAQGVVGSVVIAAGILQLELHVRRVMLAGVGAAVVACSVISTTQIGIWRDNETLFRYLDRTVEASTYRADISMRLGDTLRSKGQIAEAAQYYRDSLRLVPSRTRSAIPHFGLAKIAQAQGQLETAVFHYSAAVALQPDFAEAHLGLGEVLLAKRELPRAVTCLTTAAVLMPEHADVRDLLGAALLGSGRVVEAISEFEAAVRLSPTFARARCDYAAALMRVGRIADGLRQSEAAVTLAPNSAEAYARLGAALRTSDRLPEAVSALRRAIDLWNAASKGPRSETIRVATSAPHGRVLDSSHGAGGMNVEAADVYLNLGLALRDLGRHPEAVEALEVASRLDPDRATARDELNRLQVR
jgi:tetratricopeptide (TPR) repeat protein